MRYTVTKSFPPISCAFRQWRAQSHCRFIHGYGIEIELTFGTDELDAYNWVVDFGNMKELRQQYELMFDHKLLVADDDPQLPVLETLQQSQVVSLTVLHAVGCEMFAELCYITAEQWLKQNSYSPRVQILQAKVSEHEYNSAIYHRTIEKEDDAGATLSHADRVHRRRLQERRATARVG
jgi:6-pyruvoyltetrahydropterin/6-carboxytetrahydropterin synthase